MKKYIPGLIFIGILLSIVGGSVWLANKAEKGYAGYMADHPPGFYVDCRQSKCDIMVITDNGNKGFLGKELTPSEAEALAKDLNERAKTKGK